MKRKLFIFLALVLAVLIAMPAYAGRVHQRDKMLFDDANITTSTITTLTATTASITTLTGSGSMERHVALPLTSFLFENTAAPLSTSSTPGLEIDDGVPAMVWSDGETSKIMVTFRVPADYSSGGAFRLFTTESASTSPTKVDFQVYVNVDGSAQDAAATDQTPVALGKCITTNEVVTLTPATDFASLAAGNWVTLFIWRDDTDANADGDLETKGVEFYYTTIY